MQFATFISTRLPKEILLQTDVSEIEVSALIFERDDRPMKKNIIVYASKKLGPFQQRNSAHERECLSAIWTINKFRPYLEADCFEFLTDNAAYVMAEQS